MRHADRDVVVFEFSRRANKRNAEGRARDPRALRCAAHLYNACIANSLPVYEAGFTADVSARAGGSAAETSARNTSESPRIIETGMEVRSGGRIIY